MENVVDHAYGHHGHWLATCIAKTFGIMKAETLNHPLGNKQKRGRTEIFSRPFVTENVVTNLLKMWIFSADSGTG